MPLFSDELSNDPFRWKVLVAIMTPNLLICFKVKFEGLHDVLIDLLAYRMGQLRVLLKKLDEISA